MQHVRRCTWNPTAGKIYEVLFPDGFQFNVKPVPPTYGYGPYRKVPANSLIPYRDIFMYIGGIGGRQSVPDHYVAFKVLWNDRLVWLIYPEVYHLSYDSFQSQPIDPIRVF